MEKVKAKLEKLKDPTLLEMWENNNAQLLDLLIEKGDEYVINHQESLAKEMSCRFLSEAHDIIQYDNSFRAIYEKLAIAINDNNARFDSELVMQLYQFAIKCDSLKVIEMVKHCAVYYSSCFS